MFFAPSGRYHIRPSRDRLAINQNMKQSSPCCCQESHTVVLHLLMALISLSSTAQRYRTPLLVNFTVFQAFHIDALGITVQATAGELAVCYREKKTPFTVPFITVTKLLPFYRTVRYRACSGFAVPPSFSKLCTVASPENFTLSLKTTYPCSSKLL